MATGPITEAIQRAMGTQTLDWNTGVQTVEAVDTPFIGMLPQGKQPAQLETNWEAEKIDVGAIEGVPDNTDQTTFAHKTRIPMKTVVQELRAPWMVSKLATFTETWGVKDEIAKQKATALITLRLMVERLLLSTQDCAREGVAGASANLLRAVGRWLENDSASLNAQYPIADGLRISSSCKYSGALSGLTDTVFENLLIAAADQRKKVVDLDLIAGLSLRQKMADWTAHDPNFTTTNAALKSYTMPASEQTYMKLVEFFSFGAGKVRSHLSHNLFYTLNTGATSTQTTLGGYALDMSVWSIRFLQQITHQDIEDKGAGPRGFWSMIAALECKMPAGQVLIYPSGA